MLKVNTEKMAFYGKEQESIAEKVEDMGKTIDRARQKLVENLENGETSTILNEHMQKLSEQLIQEGKKINQMGTVLEKIANEYKNAEENMKEREYRIHK